MDLFRVKMKMKTLQIAIFLFVYFALNVEAHHNLPYVTDDAAYNDPRPHIVVLDHIRQKRDAPPANASAPAAAPAAPSPAAPAPASTVLANSTAANATAALPGNKTDDTNRTINETKTTPTPVAAVTRVPILGANGTGQRWPNLTDTKVSDPIAPDDNLTSAFETPEKVKAEMHLSNLTYDNHEFYNSSFIGNAEYFKEHWANISRPPSDVHAILSNSHRRATTVKLSFRFPFYGNWIQNITVATGGFIYTGEHTHEWLAATQYIAPLMANFDTSITNDSVVKLSDDGEKFTAFWENATLKEEPAKKFTFAVTLYKNGDIVFAYKNVPIPVEKIDDNAHPVKIGISDAYLTDKVIFYVRRKTIYEYHRVSFKNYELSNNTVLKLTALPTCLQYTSCDACVNHNTSFVCAWCENINKCSSGTDRNKQDWQLRNCEKSQVTNASSCPAPKSVPAAKVPSSPAYDTGAKDTPYHDAVVNTLPASESPSSPKAGGALSSTQEAAPPAASHPALGGVVAALVAVSLVCGAAVWALYAFKNPHTKSGQFLIRYRPSQWNWRRGEARYTAATIHM